MSTSRQKAAGSAREREVARLLGGERIGHYGGPVDVVVADYLNVQVKALRTLPSLREVSRMVDAIPIGDAMRAVVVIERAGQGKRGSRTITFDLDDWARWHGDG